MKHLYEVIPGFFINGNAKSPVESKQIPPRFGLIDPTPTGWDDLKTKISFLNASAPEGTSYRVIFLGRHGEGFHNVAERLYGPEEWNKKWAKLNGDGHITWGPDPKLTNLGIQQAYAVRDAWIAELPRGIPLPESLYTSPLSRAVHTALITFDGILINTSTALVHRRPLIKEKFREMNGVHTCDKRGPRSNIAKEFPQFDIEPGFSEDDHLWLSDCRETEDEMMARLRDALDELLSETSATYISITAHGGAARAMMKVMGLLPFELPTGGVTAFLVKVTQQHDRAT